MEQCAICEEVKGKGIYLHHSFICSPCEHNMIHTDAREQKYQYYVSKLKNRNHSTLYL